MTRQYRELVSRLEALERRANQVDISSELRYQGGANGSQISLNGYLRKLVKVTEQVYGPVFSSDGGSFVGNFYTYSWQEVAHDRVNGTFNDCTPGEAGYRNLRDLNNGVIPIDAIVEIYTQENSADNWWYVQYSNAPSYSSGYEPSDCCSACNTVHKVITGAWYDKVNDKTRQSYCYVCYPSGENLFCGCEDITADPCSGYSGSSGDGCNCTACPPKMKWTLPSAPSNSSCDVCPSIPLTGILNQVGTDCRIGFINYACPNIPVTCHGTQYCLVISIGTRVVSGVQNYYIQFDFFPYSPPSPTCGGCTMGGGIGVTDAVYYLPCSQWNCVGTNVLTKDNMVPGTQCTWPNSITLDAD